jgi:hypothetical protein
VGTRAGLDAVAKRSPCPCRGKAEKNINLKRSIGARRIIFMCVLMKQSVDYIHVVKGRVHTIKGGVFPDQLMEYELLKKNSASYCIVKFRPIFVWANYFVTLDRILYFINIMHSKNATVTNKWMEKVKWVYCTSFLAKFVYKFNLHNNHVSELQDMLLYVN